MLDYMDGRELTHVIKEYGEHYSDNFMKYSIYMAAKGLADMHSQGILHRDIKSDNILCNRNGDIKLADLDVAVFLTEERPFRKSFCGTDEWMSPELVQKMPYAKEVDIWAFGAFIHELGCGTTPFPEEQEVSERALFRAIVEKTVPPIEKRCEQFNNLMLSCLEKDVTKRTTAKDILRHPYLAGASTLRQQWVEEYDKYVKLKLAAAASGKAKH